MVASYAVFVLAEYSSWIAITVLAFARGGATEAGLVALAQLVPAAVMAPVISRVAETRRPVQVRIVGHLVQAGGLVVAAVAAFAGVPLVAYAGAIVTSMAVVSTRPAQAAMLPALAETPEQLTSANVGLGWVENLGIAGAGLMAGLLLAVADPEVTLGVSAALFVLAAVAILPIHVPAAGDGPQPGGAEERDAWSPLRDPTAGLLLGFLTVQWLIVGALDVLFVVLAVDVLGAGQAWVGYLQASFGVGALVASGIASLLVGKRLGVPILLTALLQALVLAATAATHSVLLVAVLLAVVGGNRAVLDVAGRTLLQRAVSPHLLGRTFGVLESLTMGGRAVGSLLVPALILLGGSRAALVGLAVVLVLGAAIGGRRLFTVDAEADVPVVEISLLRSMRLFSVLGPPALEAVARALERRDLPPGTPLITEGEIGDFYYVIGSGEVHVMREGRSLGHRVRGDGVGEVALLRDVPRTATVIAATPVTAYVLDREAFLTAVTGHDMAREAAHVIVEERLRDEDPGAKPHPTDEEP
jgi:hypothetical protein